jgi:hypothetical protein
LHYQQWMRCIVHGTHIYFLSAIRCTYTFLCGHNWIILVTVFMIRLIPYRFVWVELTYVSSSLLLDTCTLFTVNLKTVFNQHVQQTFIRIKSKITSCTGEKKTRWASQFG